MPQETPVFQESQYFSPSFYAMFLACLIMVYVMPAVTPGIGTSMLPIEILFTAAMLLTFNLLFMRTTVAEGEIEVKFGWLFTLYSKRIPLDAVSEIEPVRYEPMKDYGGWGIRGWGKRRALNARGEVGVLLTLADNSKLLIGSQVPQELADAAQAAKKRSSFGTPVR